MHATRPEPISATPQSSPPESWQTRVFRWKMNLFPAFWCTGGSVTYIAPDFREIRVDVPLNLRTRNLVGTMFGGSMFAATDPVYMIMLIRLLGRDYIVWDKGGSIRFLKPGRGTLHARFIVPQQETDTIKAALQIQRSVDRLYTVELKDDEGIVCASIERVIYVRAREQKDAVQKPEINM